MPLEAFCKIRKSNYLLNLGADVIEPNGFLGYWKDMTGKETQAPNLVSSSAARELSLNA